MRTYRPFESLDYPAIAANLQEAGMFDEAWDARENLVSIAQSDHPLSSVTVLERNGELAASVYTIPWGENVAFFFRLCVSSNMRGQGIGSSLLSHVEANLRLNGAKEIAAFYSSDNEALTSFYEKRGYHNTPGHSFTCIWKPES
jgi:ribosomal protein S18 acetylase RimI-like enzyme